MSIITLPATMRLKSIQWTLDRPAQVNRQPYTGSRRVVTNPWHGKWSAQCQFAPVIGEANFRQWQAFFALLKGQVNTFLLPATETAQGVADTTVTSGAAQGGTTLVMAAARTVTAGMKAALTLPSGNRQLVMITVASSGTTLTFEPPLREGMAVGAAVALANPVCHVALADSAFSYTADAGQLYNISFSAEEAF